LLVDLALDREERVDALLGLERDRCFLDLGDLAQA
jgi:hypothetical protein